MSIIFLSLMIPKEIFPRIAGLMVEIEYPLAGAVGQAYATAYLDVVLTGHGNGRMVITGQAIGLDNALYLVYVVRVGGIAATLDANNPIVIVIGRKLAEITVLLVTLYDTRVVGYAFFHGRIVPVHLVVLGIDDARAFPSRRGLDAKAVVA